MNKVTTLLIVLCKTIISSGLEGDGVPYDYTFTSECLPVPHGAQYNGGIIKNPELNNGIKGWSTFGNAKMEHRTSEGNMFLVAHTRNQTYDSISQKVYLHKNMLYTFSAWLRVSKGKIPVTATFKTKTGFKHAGSVIAEANCWSMLKGGLTVEKSAPAQLYFESKDASVEIWVDSISLQPFTERQWQSHQEQSIEKTRRRNVRIQVVDKQNRPLPNTTISLKQKKMGFPFGCAINKNILTNTAYQAWFAKRFTVTTFEDEMKWYSTESSPGHEDYSVPDSMVQFAQQHSISIRGHNVLWDDPHYQSSWVSSLGGDQLRAAANKRVNSVMNRYRGKVIGWDVVNENLHFSFFEDKLGQGASTTFYKMAQDVDGATTMFLNDYNTIEDDRDSKSSPSRYLNKIKQIQQGGCRNLGIGLEGHFKTPNAAYIRSAIDTLASAGLPIWITELDVESGPDQAQFLEQILREVHSHPKVKGVVIWAAWKPQGCYRMCLTDNNFNNLATGNVVDKLLKEWGGLAPSLVTTDSQGFIEASLFHGEYTAKIMHPGADVDSLSSIWSFEVALSETSAKTLILQVSSKNLI